MRISSEEEMSKSPGQILLGAPDAAAEYLNDMPWEDKRQVLKIPPTLFAKIYKAGVIYALNMENSNNVKED